jgi:hypothetical protein
MNLFPVFIKKEENQKIFLGKKSDGGTKMDEIF